MHYSKLFNSIFFFLILTSTTPHLSSGTAFQSLTSGSSLSVERLDDILISPDHSFSAGFHPLGDNAYCFAIWFTQSANFTPVWMANRDHPVNGKRSSLSLRRDATLVLTDADQYTVWTTNTPPSASPMTQLRLTNSGNLILQNSTNITVWQSFDFPADTLLPNQPLTANMKLISSRSRSNYSSGFYSFYFDADKILKLLFSSPDASSIYWPDQAYLRWSGRKFYNISRTAVFDSSGYFLSSDGLNFSASDYGLGPKRRLTMDYDGNLRLYSLDEKAGTWAVSWHAVFRLCRIHGLCGPNSLCSYVPGRRCSCLPGFRMKDPSDWSQGCDPIFNLSCNARKSRFIKLPYIDFFGNDIAFDLKLTFEACERMCLNSCSCKVFLYRWDGSAGVWNCNLKILLLNGIRSSRWDGTSYLKVPKNFTDFAGESDEAESLKCSPNASTQLFRMYAVPKENASLKFAFWFVGAIGVVEIICIFLGWWYLFREGGSDAANRGYILAATGFKKFTYEELKKATGNFSQEIGRGGGGVVYKGVLSDQRVAAIKQLEGINQGEADFFAEVSIIGRINHMNLIQMWGFCAQGNHRLLVSEYMEHGSLAQNLSSNALDWDKRFEIAQGTAKGLAYLHEECLEWVLHCDIKPQNILLDSDYQPKVADFGLSKLLDRRRGIDNSSFSTIRGTRGYMAPEWILNLPITSKVDVYSYGILVLEMVTGKKSTGFNNNSVDQGGEGEQWLVPWVRDVMSGGATSSLRERMEEIMDTRIDSRYNLFKMELLVRVALQCVEERRDARPTMRRVVEMLSCEDYEY